MRQLILDIRPDAPPRFDNFLAGRNAEAVAALRALAGGTASEALIYIWGEAGSGKSHLLRACVAEVLACGQSARYVAPGMPLPDELPALLAVDAAEQLPAGAQVALFNSINRSREGEGRIVVAGDRPPARLPLRPDLATRLGWGLVFGLNGLDEAERTAALQARAAARGLCLADEVLAYMLTHCRRDLPGLLATVDALDEYSLSRKRPVTLPLLREMLRAD
ncbi:MAG: DnaA regulatory inactivator Hda [Betaproteobacteria bacterium]|nr:DnaA regulatory inactivator Hda [Betaproteobacteria bacterium]